MTLPYRDGYMDWQRQNGHTHESSCVQDTIHSDADIDRWIRNVHALDEVTNEISGTSVTISCVWYGVYHGVRGRHVFYVIDNEYCGTID